MRGSGAYGWCGVCLHLELCCACCCYTPPAHPPECTCVLRCVAPAAPHPSLPHPLPHTHADRGGDKSGIFMLGGRCDPSTDGDPTQ